MAIARTERFIAKNVSKNLTSHAMLQIRLKRETAQKELADLPKELTNIILDYSDPLFFEFYVLSLNPMLEGNLNALDHDLAIGSFTLHCSQYSDPDAGLAEIKPWGLPMGVVLAACAPMHIPMNPIFDDFKIYEDNKPDTIYHYYCRTTHQARLFKDKPLVRLTDMPKQCEEIDYSTNHGCTIL